MFPSFCRRKTNSVTSCLSSCTIKFFKKFALKRMNLFLQERIFLQELTPLRNDAKVKMADMLLMVKQAPEL